MGSADAIKLIKKFRKDLNILENNLNNEVIPVCPRSVDKNCGPNFGGTCCPSGTYCTQQQNCSTTPQDKDKQPYAIWSEDYLKDRPDHSKPVCPEAESGQRCGPEFGKCCKHQEFCSHAEWCGTSDEHSWPSKYQNWTIDNQTARPSIQTSTSLNLQMSNIE